MASKVSLRIASAAARAPLVLRALLASTHPDRFVVLCYHRVNDSGHPYFGGVPAELFREQLELLKRTFNVCPLGELLDRRERGRPVANAVALTFDDGYRDNYTQAFPILRELSLPATIYLVSGAVSNNAMIWHDRVFDAFHRTRCASLAFEGEELDVSSDDTRRRSLMRVLERVRRCDSETRARIVDEVTRALEVSGPSDDDWDKLSWEEVREMSAHGVTFGAHTVDHPILSHLDRDEAARQIRDSRQAIESALGEPVRDFAYPNGRDTDYTEETKRILADEGFRSAVTTMSGANDDGSDPFALKRLGMWGPDPYLSVLRLARGRRIA